jgi:hypothetical protein
MGVIPDGTALHDLHDLTCELHDKAVVGISKVDSCSEQKWNIRVVSKSGKMGDVGVD